MPAVLTCVNLLTYLTIRYLFTAAGSLERIVDIFLAMAVATRHEARLYKLVSQTFSTPLLRFQIREFVT